MFLHECCIKIRSKPRNQAVFDQRNEYSRRIQVLRSCGTALSVGQSPTGTGGLPVLPIFRRGSQPELTSAIVLFNQRLRAPQVGEEVADLLVVEGVEQPF